MKIDILTLFPAMFTSPFDESIIARAVERGTVSITPHNLRDWAEGRHQITDDTPYGGGGGMVMKPEPICRGIAELKEKSPTAIVVLMTPQGEVFKQNKAAELAASSKDLIFVCGRYEGFDERVRSVVDCELSIGDFVLTGGEIASMVVVDAVVRLLPGVLGNNVSSEFDSHSDGLLEYPHYTRPFDYNGEKVPDVLLSGDHKAIADWRRREQIRRTKLRRPDLLESAPLDKRDRKWLKEIEQDSLEKNT